MATTIRPVIVVVPSLPVSRATCRSGRSRDAVELHDRLLADDEVGPIHALGPQGRRQGLVVNHFHRPASSAESRSPSSSAVIALGIAFERRDTRGAWPAGP